MEFNERRSCLITGLIDVELDIHSLARDIGYLQSRSRAIPPTAAGSGDVTETGPAIRGKQIFRIAAIAGALGLFQIEAAISLFQRAFEMVVGSLLVAIAAVVIDMPDGEP